MKTHTIRNKSSPNPIITLTPDFFDRFMECYPEASSLAFNWFNQSYKNLTGKNVHLDYDQSLVWSNRAGIDANGAWKSKFSTLPPTLYYIVRSFEAGLLNSISHDFETVLEIANEFYSMMDQHNAIQSA